MGISGALACGVGLGLAYHGLLWLGVGRMLAGKRGWATLRLGGVACAFWSVAGPGPWLLVAMLSGFLVGRQIALYRVAS